MKVALNLSTSRSNFGDKRINRVNSVNNRNTSSTPNLISFGGNKIANQVALVTAESSPYFKVGGVATVVADYPKNVFDNSVLFMPYYNGQRFYNDKGEILQDVKILKNSEGKLILTNENLKKFSLDEITAPNSNKKYWELEEIITKNMDWAGGTEKIGLYKVKGQPHYMVYTSDTARMAKPYAGGFWYSSNSMPKSPLGVGGDSYAKFCKAFVELLPYAEEKGVNPQHILLNDSQTAFVPEYIAKSIVIDQNPYYKGASMSFVQHNLGEAYQGVTSNREMFFDFATNRQVRAVFDDPIYAKALLNGTTEDYFAPYVQKFQRTNNTVAASSIPVNYALTNNLTHISTVSEDYAQSAIDNPNVANGLTDKLKELQDKGKYSGILNGMNSPSIDPMKPINLTYYKETVSDNLGQVHNPYLTYNSNMPIEEIENIKQLNARNLFRRLKDGVEAKYAIGKDDALGVLGYIDDKWVQKIDNKEKVNLFVSWGRADEQKGLDVVLDAFSKFVRTKEGENAVLILGGELKGQSAEQIVKGQMDVICKDPFLKGRVAFMNGFAPNSVLAGAADAAIFPSRFAPCELTDLEAMKYGTTPIVTNLQGLKQKNFDPRIPEEATKATSYRTKAHSIMSIDELKNADSQFAKFYNKLFSEMQRELELAQKANYKKFTQEEIKKIVSEKILKSDELKIAYKEATDRLISNDLVEAMIAKVSETPQLREKMVKNAMNAKSAWQDNNLLHGIGINKSSKDLYIERHLKGNFEVMSSTCFDYAKMPIQNSAVVGRQFSESSQNLLVNSYRSIVDLIHKPACKKFAMAFAGIASIGALGYYLFKPEKTAKSHSSTYIV